MYRFRQMLLGTVAIGFLGVVGSPVQAGEIEKSIAVSGHINRAIIVSDNGENTAVSQTDSTRVAGSRFRINASVKSDSMTIKTSMELGVQSNGSLGSHATADTTSINIRQSYIALSNSMGTFTIGHTGVADDSVAGNKLSGTGNAGFYGDSLLHGEELRITGDTGTASSGVTVGGVLSDLDAKRANTVKYKTPDMAGFTVTVGFANQDHGAARLDYKADYDGTKVSASASWGSRGGTAAIDAVWGGSVAVSLANGLNGSVAYTQRDLNSAVAANVGLSDPAMVGASIGYKAGVNGITAWYMQVDDLGANNNKAESYALVVQHDLPDYGTSFYGGIQNVSYDVTGTTYDDTTGAWVGVRTNF